MTRETVKVDLKKGIKDKYVVVVSVLWLQHYLYLLPVLPEAILSEFQSKK